MGDRYLGVFEAVGSDYREVIHINDEGGIKFEHVFYSNGIEVLREFGTVEIKEYSIYFNETFTECVDSESARPLAKPIALLNYSMILLREGSPESDRILPFDEHQYYLTKKAEQGGDGDAEEAF